MTLADRQIEPSLRSTDAVQTTSRAVTISMRVVQLLVDAVEQTGVPRAEIMRVIGGHSLAFSDLDARISMRDAERICELALALTGDQALALRWAEGLTERSFAPVSHLVGYAGSLRGGLAQLSAFESLFCDRSFYTLSESEELATLSLFTGWTFSSQRMARFAAEMAVAGLLVVIRLFSPNAGIVRVCFDYPAPPYEAAYARAFGDRARFAQPFTGVVFDRAILDLPAQHADNEIQSAMQTVAERRLLRVAAKAPSALRVRELLKQLVAERPNMSDVARSLGLSVRSLRRQLSAEGTSYRTIEHAALASEAERLLCDNRLSIQEAAYAMGFSDAATFHRALKQWTGKTPSELRESRSTSL